MSTPDTNFEEFQQAVQSAMDTAMNALDNNELETALKIFEDVHLKVPYLKEAGLGRSVALFRMGRVSSSLKLVSTIIDGFPDYEAAQALFKVIVEGMDPARPLYCTAEEYLKKNPSEGLNFDLPFTGNSSSFSVTVLNNIRALGPFGLLVTSTGVRLRESVIDTNINHALQPVLESLEHGQDIVPKQRLNGDCLPLIGVWSEGFFHWVLEWLPRAMMAKMCGFNGSYIIRQNSAKFVRDSLNAIGVPNNQIIEVPPTHWEAERMWMPSSVPACTMIHNPEVLTELRKQILAACSSTPTSISSKRIYLSRRNPKRPRRVLNEDQLASILKSFGFEIVDTEKMTFSEQVAMISQAEFLIGPSGAGMIHSLFLPEGSTVLELFPADYINPVGFKPSKLLNHRYYMVSNNLNQEILSDPGNIVANLEIIEHMLKMDLSRTPYSA